MGGLWNILRLLRPHNMAAAVLSVACGCVLAPGREGCGFALLAATALVTAAGNVINDIYDRDIDSMNRPGRPIPSGSVGVTAAAWFYGTLLAGAFLSALLLPPVQAAWIAVWAVLLHVYSSSLKRALLWGNILVSAVSASGFLLGAQAGGAIGAGIVPAAYTFVFVMGREIVKDVEDIEGDMSCGARTLPVVAGKGAALDLSAAVFITLAVVFPVPWALGIYGDAYIVLMLGSVIPLLVASAVFALRRSRIPTVRTLLKTGMFFGIAAFYLGSR